MIMNSRARDYRAKQEGDPNVNKLSKTPSTSRQLAGFTNPRIVRVSRSFGGKDRHSKVCTVRGLRDRRIRLSVQTAIQLYDLQDRLGLSQPSKVVDWLLDATKNEIDKLPPLQMPPGNFSQFLQPLAVSQQSSAGPQSSVPKLFDANPSYMKDGRAQAFLSSKEGIKISDHIHGNDQEMVDRGAKYWSTPDGASHRKETERQTVAEKEKWIASNQQENQEGIECYAAQLTAQNFFPMGNQSSFPNLLNNASPYNPYYHLEPPNLSLSHFGRHSYPNQAAEDSHVNYPMSSISALPSGSQLYFCPSAATLPTIIPPLPPYLPTPSVNDPRQVNHFQLQSSSSQQHALPNSLMPTLHLISPPMKSRILNANPKITHSQENQNNP